MPITSNAGFLEALRQTRLLEAIQLQEISRSLQRRFPEPRALAKELMQRGWLTPYQINQLFQGHGPDLVLGQYVLLERLGEGGMGAVFKARHLRLDRLVALKLIRKEFLSHPEAVRRFKREIQAAAQLMHPHIVLAFDADQVANVHFFAMEYVSGMNLSALVKKVGPLSIAQACSYISQAAAGLQHAHQHGMVHRDIKPSNLLVSQTDPRNAKSRAGDSEFEQWALDFGLVKILDMGLARLHTPLSDEDTPSQLSREGAVMGTPDFIAPEQARDSHAADSRADIYSLGCTLYYVLTGHVPFPGGTLTEKLLKHQMDEPLAIEEVRPEVPAELAHVLRTMMAKRPDDRYQTPAAVITAIKALPQLSPERAPPGLDLADAPLTATEAANERRQSQQTADARRWRRLVAGGVLCLLLGCVFLGYLLTRENRPPAAPEPEEIPPTVEEAPPLTLKGLLAQVGDPNVDQENVRLGLIELRRQQFGAPEALRAAEALTMLRSPLDKLEAAKIPGFERYAWLPKELVHVLGEQRRRHWSAVRSVAYSPDGRFLASGGDDHLLRVWEAASGNLVLRFGMAGVTSIAFQPDGKALLAGNQTGSVHVWPLGADAKSLRHDDKTVLAVAYAPDGKSFAWACADGKVKVWDVVDHKERCVLNGHASEVFALAYSPDNATLATAGAEGKVKLWDVANARESAVLQWHASAVHALAFARDGKTLASGGDDHAVCLWDVPTRRRRLVYTSHDKKVLCVAFTPDGRHVASGGADQVVRIWNAASSKEEFVLEGHLDGVSSLAFAPDGKTLATASLDGTVRCWDPATGTERAPLHGHHANVRAVAFAPDNCTLASGGDDRKVFEWTLSAGAHQEGITPLSVREWHGAAITSLAYSPDGLTLASGSLDHTVRLWNVMPNSGHAAVLKKLILRGHERSVTGVAYAPDGQTVASTSEDKTVRLWDVMTGKARLDLTNNADGVACVAFAPDGLTLATACLDGTVNLWDTATGAERAAFSGGSGVHGLDYHPEGKLLATATLGEPRLRLWDAFTRKVKSALPGTTGHYTALAFSPDGRKLAATTREGKIAVWDVATGDKGKEWEMPGPVYGVAFAADSRHLATANGNGTIYILRLASPTVKTNK